MTPLGADAAHEIEYVNLSPGLAPACHRLEIEAFPAAEPSGLFSEQEIRLFAEVFPEGYFVALDDGVPVGQAAGIFVDFNFKDHAQHAVPSLGGPNELDTHNPDGDWYYGLDVVVAATYRGRGIGRTLYNLRKGLVRSYGRRGIVAGGDLPGYPDHAATMDVETYVARVVAGELNDPTLTMQLRSGFEVRGVIHEYMPHKHGYNDASLLVWENPDYSG